VLHFQFAALGSFLRNGFLLLVALSLSPPCFAGDWPTHRYDARRSACSPDALPATLKPAWQHTFPAFETAFPNEPRLQFDTSYEPVCAGNTVVVGSPVDGSVRAFSAETGKPFWVYHTEAPVRLAPALHCGKVLVGSDDGVFRCLDLADGTLQWSFNGYPEGRPDMRLLGNNRLISMWPVRGGPVVVGDVVYFACGVWPTMGVYVHALDIATGKPVWGNPHLAHMTNVRIDHNLLYDAGASPQGYLLAAGDKLVIPNGRSHPIALNRADGSMFYFVQGYRNGNCRVAIGGNYAFVGPRGIVSLTDFREVGNKWTAAGKNAPNHFDMSKYDQFEGPFHPYKHFPGCNADSVFDGATAYSLARGVVYAHDLSKAVVSEYEKAQGSRVSKPYRWDAPTTMRVPTGLDTNGRLHIKAGNRLYGHAGNNVVAIELTGATPPAKVLWRQPTEALPTAMIAAADRLIVALENGTLLCLAEDGAGVPRIVDTSAPEPAPPSEALQGILGSTVVRDGFCVILGELSGDDVIAALQQTKLRLLVVAEDATKVNALRESTWKDGNYGKRIEVLHGKPLAFRLPPYLASLTWVRGAQAGALTTTQLKHVWASVRPYGGELCFTGSDDQRKAFEAIARSCALDGCRISASDTCVVLTREPGPAGAADWTHETADAARSYYSRDTAVKTPIAPIWFGDGPDYGFIKQKDYGRGVKPQVVEGRVFALQQSSRILFAYDAYTGRLLWRQHGKDKMRRFITRFVSRPEGVYAAGGGVCVVYDPATGKELRTLDYRSVLPETSKARAAGIVVTDMSVLVAAANEDTGAIEQGLWDADVIICLDRESGTVRWHREAEARLNIKAFAVGDGLVFCTDSLSPLATEKWKRRAGNAKQTGSTLFALDEVTGSVKWTHTYEANYRQHGAGGWLSVRTRDDWLAYSSATKQLLGGREEATFLLNAADGSVVWNKKVNLSQPVVLMGDRLLDQGARIVELATGKVLKSGMFHRGGCNYAVANRHLAFLRDQTVCTVDLESGDRQRLRNMRSGCSASIVPASGILNIPNFARGCVCNYPVQTSSAWIHTPGVTDWGEAGDSLKLTPLEVNPGIPIVSAAEAEAMHAFERRFFVDDPKVAAEHLIGRWTFDAATPDNPAVFPDLSKSKADATVSNPAFEPRATGQALTCGADKTKTIAKAEIKPKGPVRDAVTLCAWVKLGETQHKGSAGVVERIQFYRIMVGQTKPPYSLSFSLQTEAKSWRSVSTPANLKAGEWFHVAASFDGEVGELVIYINGKQAGKASSAPGWIPPVTGLIDMGVRDTGAFLNGALDDVRVYDRALGPKAIAPMLTE